MIEFWQAGVLSVATLLVGGLMGLLTSSVQRRWTLSDVREAEEREERRRISAEKRQVLRELRRERMKGFLDFLDMAKRYAGRNQQLNTLKSAYDDNVAGMKDMGPWEGLKATFEKRRPPLNVYDLGDAFSVALSTAAPVDVRATLLDVFASCDKSAPISDAVLAVRRAEETLEQYLVDVPSADQGEEG